MVEEEDGMGEREPAIDDRVGEWERSTTEEEEAVRELVAKVAILTETVPTKPRSAGVPKRSPWRARKAIRRR